jgi:feruloyl esterase
MGKLGARNTWINQAMYPDPHDLSRAVIGPEEAELIGKAVLDRCDSLDGLENGILNNPLQCEFDVSSLACGSGETNPCLTTQEVGAPKTNPGSGPGNPSGSKLRKLTLNLDQLMQAGHKSGASFHIYPGS